MQVDTLKKKKWANTLFLTLQTKIKSYVKNTTMFLMELERKSKNKWGWMWLWKRLHETWWWFTIKQTIKIPQYDLEEDGKLYPQVFLHDSLDELNI